MMENKKVPNPVQGYIFDGVGDEHADRNATVCKIIDRVEGTDTLEFGPRFLVEFGDLFQMTAYSAELSPWYQTE